MNHATEKIDFVGHTEEKREKHTKDRCRSYVKMFVCEEHVKLWIKPKFERKGTYETIEEECRNVNGR